MPETGLQIIKVCGVTRVNDAVEAARVGATAIGMIFYPLSPRFIDVAGAELIAAAVGGQALKVGVFVNADAEEIRSTVSAVGLDVVQLHGDEPPELVAELSELRVWKALRVSADFDPASPARFDCEAFVLDAPSSVYGGSGEVFPWEQALEAKRHGRVIVAGGLDSENVARAIEHVRPWGVDSSSRLESKPGVKEHGRVFGYVRAARKA